MGQISREFNEFYPLRTPGLEARIKVSAVSYINSFPFIYGLENSAVADRIELQLDNPAACADKLKSGEVDLGLIPVAEIPNVPNARVIGNYCIGAEGPVESVCLYSEVPLEEIETVLLDPESRTSVRLARILAQKKWNILPKWKAAQSGFESSISGSTAGVVIGDRAFKLNEKELLRWDLSEEWQELMGLPFVFAAWVANKDLPSAFEEQFDQALKHGLNHKPEAMEKHLNSQSDLQSKLDYVNHRIQYLLDERKHQALERFLSMAVSVEIK